MLRLHTLIQHIYIHVFPRTCVGLYVAARMHVGCLRYMCVCCLIYLKKITLMEHCMSLCEVSKRLQQHQ